jgi:DNA polymerase-3 subunit delta
LMRAVRLVARADLELRSSPPDKKRVLERLVMDLCTEPKPPRIWSNQQQEMAWA